MVEFDSGITVVPTSVLVTTSGKSYVLGMETNGGAKG